MDLLLDRDLLRLAGDALLNLLSLPLRSRGDNDLDLLLDLLPLLTGERSPLLLRNLGQCFEPGDAELLASLRLGDGDLLAPRREVWLRLLDEGDEL